MIVAMGSFVSAHSSLKEVNKAFEMLENREGEIVLLLILPWGRA